jgi:D-alanyl-D-alanine carboxypeptidase
MKRQWIAILCIFLLILSPLLVSVSAMAETKKSGSDEWPSGPSINAESAIVMEASTGLILYEKNMNDKHYPASTTKIMTALLGLENSSLGDTVTFSKNAIYNVESGSSVLPANVGEQLTMQQCIYALMLISGNDVAYAIAEHCAGNVDKFADLMNKKAKELGCKNTHFTNPHGLPNNDHYSTAYDLALITQEAMKNESFRKIAGTRRYVIPPTNKMSDTRYLLNHHKLISKEGFSYDGIIGGKTGYTTISKYNLVTVAKRGDLELICVVMKDDNILHQYTDTEKLFDYGFNNFSIYPIADLDNSTVMDETPLFTKYNSLLSESDSPISIDSNGYLILPNTASSKDAKREVSFYTTDSKEKDIAASSDTDSKQNIIGKISYSYDGKYVGSANILYNNKKSPSLAQTDSNIKNPTSAPTKSDTSSKSGGSPIPFIIGGIVGLIVIGGALYYFIQERQRLRRRHAYYKKRALHKKFNKDDFLDL